MASIEEVIAAIDVLAPLVAVRSDAARFVQQRPNDTTAYTAGDVVGMATSPGGSGAGPALMTFTFPKLAALLANGGEFLITSTELERDVAALISGETSYSLYLYDAPPLTVLVDNGVFDIAAADRINFIGKLNLGTPVDEVSTLYVPADGVNKQVTLRNNTMYGYLVTVGAYTPAANTVLKVTLHGIVV